jgi:hypothetical protein
MRCLALPWIGLLAAACTPETDLTNIPTGGGSTAGSGGGVSASGELVDPAAGSNGVPTNLAAVTVRFPAPVTFGADGLRVCDGGAASVPVAVPEAVPCDGGTCYRAALTASLPAGFACPVGLGDGNTDTSGAALPAGVLGVFETAAAADITPPVLGDVAVASAGPCLVVSFSTDEPASGTVSIVAAGLEVDSPAGVGQTKFQVAIPLGALPPESSASITVSAVDRAGNAASGAPLAFETPAALPPVAITEVLANPKGPEPAQEYVELRNLGDADVALAGLRIEDSKGGDDLPAETLAAGAYALVVASGYDPAEGDDPAPRAGTLLLRVDSRIGADGLSNGGEVVKLVLGDAVVSSYGGWVDVSAGSWNGRAVHRLIQTACDAAEAWNHAPLIPTPGAEPP